MKQHHPLLRNKLIAIVTCLLLASLLFPTDSFASSEAAARRPAAQPLKVVMTVRVDPTAQLASSLSIDSPALTKALLRAKYEPADQVTVYPDVEISITQQQGQQKLYRLEKQGNLWDETNHQRLVPTTEAANQLRSLAELLRSQYYGKLIDWSSARELVPRKSIFTITDVASGRSFRVQRRAGSDHADVQPITKEDSRIMKEIYGGAWSWNRKAVLVHSGDNWIAASMNGMPHGGDGIPDNDFSGHFCVHFLGSTTHKSDNPDVAHQLMIHKAAGLVRDYLDQASPALLASSFVEALDHDEPYLLAQIANGLSAEKLTSWTDQMPSIRSIRVDKPNKSKEAPYVDDGALTAQIRLNITELRQSEHRTSYLFQFSRPTAKSSWVLTDVTSGK
ncbi:hypothetical protein DFQ01_104293 [Paenibacillus cellulosilyticus]|uniref:Uncharacterized protein n=1 Tax=Paenibacillus cellulosilyticus TaxID=375489 RepID=A0A2V2YWI7_9BACL|nr:hypothetical protein [Paenibacillus cellulosilyticus]PWW05731.1 hypothetical protein DFQ01_104293 [Paenibacillus cellulosilyticus]QKS45256.1 hypothetical protein HUB94_13140 [Paenibacillus cellulosilyticus]